jgi:large subunit ribosomal protein L23
MALFKKDSKEVTTTENNQDLSWVLIAPRITEKAAMVSGNNVFTFDVAVRANKIQIKKAIIEQYKVTPVSINVINQKPRKVIKRGRKAHQKGTKKAMVTLKKGDTIELA